MSITLPELLSDPVRAFCERRHGLLIDGEWRPAAAGATFTTEDPATTEVIAEVAYADAEDVDRAVGAARRALEQGPWARITPADRGRLIGRLADLIEERAGELAELDALDNGKPVKLARIVDIASASAAMRYAAGWPTKLTGEVIPHSLGDALNYTRRVPVGVCGAIIPWNFPVLMAVWKLAPALAAGCTVILKPAEQTPLSALRLGELVLEAGIPAGVVNVLTGDGATGAAIVEHPGVDKISFTGSTAVGREIAARCGRALKRVTLELGGKSANIVLPDADMKTAARGSFQAAYFNTGQACLAGTRLYVQSGSFDDVVGQLAEAASGTRVGPGLEKGTQLGPVVSAEQYERVRGYIDAGLAEGAELVAGGGRGREGDRGYFIEPTLFTATDDTLRVAREEIFGPVLVAMPYDDLDEVARRANDTEYGLAAGLWTRDVGAAHKLAHKLRAGSVYVNGWGKMDPASPFGGFKASGLGREHGSEGVGAYLETQSIWVDLS